MTEKEFLSSVINAARLVIISEAKAIQLIESYYRNKKIKRENTESNNKCNSN